LAVCTSPQKALRSKSRRTSHKKRALIATPNQNCQRFTVEFYHRGWQDQCSKLHGTYRLPAPKTVLYLDSAQVRLIKNEAIFSEYHLIPIG
jgi:hypothetical protein